MVRVISQETYDDFVKENIEDLDMTPEEAVKEAIAQLEAQGVDLSNIIKDLALSSKGEHVVTTIVNKLTELWNGSKQSEDICVQMKLLKTECEKDIAYKIKAGKDGAYKLLIDFLEYSLNENKSIVLLATVETLYALMDMQPDLLDEKGADIIKRLLSNPNESITIESLKWISACCLKHEKNRQMIFGKNITGDIKTILSEQKSKKLINQALLVIRRMCLDDDVRVEFGKAHEHAREMAVHTLDELITLLKENTEPPLVSAIMLTMASVLVRNEFCQTVADAGVTEVLLSILAANYSNTSAVQEAFKLLTALAGNDNVKRLLIKSGIAPLLVLVIIRNMNNPTTVALGMKCMAALALREPDHSVEFIQNGGPEAISEAMKKYPDDATVQKNACWAIRNMVGRCKDHNSKFLELGVEQYLNDAYKKYEKDFGYDIKSALRDLECDVKLQEQWTGKGVQMQND